MTISDDELYRRWRDADDSGDTDLSDALSELMDRRADEYIAEAEQTTHYAEWREPLIDPALLALKLEEHARWMEEWATVYLKDPGNPATFQIITHRELGHPITEATHALAEQWAATPPPPPEKWQTHIRLCPYRTGEKFLGADLILDPRVPRDTIAISTPRPFFHQRWHREA